MPDFLPRLRRHLFHHRHSAATSAFSWLAASTATLLLTLSLSTRAAASCYICVEQDDAGVCQLSSQPGAHCACSADPFTPGCWMQGYCLFGTCEPALPSASYFASDPWTTDDKLVLRVAQISPELGHAIASFERHLALEQDATPVWYGKFFERATGRQTNALVRKSPADGSWTFAIRDGAKLRVQGGGWTVTGKGIALAGVVAPNPAYAVRLKARATAAMLPDTLK